MEKHLKNSVEYMILSEVNRLYKNFDIPMPMLHLRSYCIRNAFVEALKRLLDSGDLVKVKVFASDTIIAGAAGYIPRGSEESFYETRKDYDPIFSDAYDVLFHTCCLPAEAAGQIDQDGIFVHKDDNLDDITGSRLAALFHDQCSNFDELLELKTFDAALVLIKNMLVAAAEKEENDKLKCDLLYYWAIDGIEWLDSNPDFDDDQNLEKLMKIAETIRSLVNKYIPADKMINGKYVTAKYIDQTAPYDYQLED